MKKCRVVDLLETSWGPVAVLDFFKPTAFKVGDRLKSSKNLIWLITRVSKGKLTVQNFESLKDSINIWDCTIKPIDHTQLPIINEELVLIQA